MTAHRETRGPASLVAFRLMLHAPARQRLEPHLVECVAAQRDAACVDRVLDGHGPTAVRSTAKREIPCALARNVLPRRRATKGH